MKKTKWFLVGILVSLCACFGAFVLSACEEDVGTETPPAHTHTYDKEIVDDTYLKSGATCKTKATYYKSCQCGEKGVETFEVRKYTATVYNTR